MLEETETVMKELKSSLDRKYYQIYLIKNFKTCFNIWIFSNKIKGLDAHRYRVQDNYEDDGILASCVVDQQATLTLSPFDRSLDFAH